jgi:type 1 glutamine amidotransferase
MVSEEDEWTRHLPKQWQFDKVEWYFWNYHANFEKVHIIATADVKQNQPELPEHYPVTWAQVYEGGRVWYTNMGHYAENFHQKEFKQHIVDGIKWAGEGDR